MRSLRAALPLRRPFSTRDRFGGRGALALDHQTLLQFFWGFLFLLFLLGRFLDSRKFAQDLDAVFRSPALTVELQPEKLLDDLVELRAGRETKRFKLDHRHRQGLAQWPPLVEIVANLVERLGVGCFGQYEC